MCHNYLPNGTQGHNCNLQCIQHKHYHSRLAFFDIESCKLYPKILLNYHNGKTLHLDELDGVEEANLLVLYIEVGSRAPISVIIIAN